MQVLLYMHGIILFAYYLCLSNNSWEESNEDLNKLNKCCSFSCLMSKEANIPKKLLAAHLESVLWIHEYLSKSRTPSLVSSSTVNIILVLFALYIAWIMRLQHTSHWCPSELQGITRTLSIQWNWKYYTEQIAASLFNSLTTDQGSAQCTLTVSVNLFRVFPMHVPPFLEYIFEHISNGEVVLPFSHINRMKVRKSNNNKYWIPNSLFN